MRAVDLGDRQSEVLRRRPEGLGPICRRRRQRTRQLVRAVPAEGGLDGTLHDLGGRQIICQFLQNHGQIEQVLYPRAPLPRTGVGVQLLREVIRQRLDRHVGTLDARKGQIRLTFPQLSSPSGLPPWPTSSAKPVKGLPAAGPRRRSGGCPEALPSSVSARPSEHEEVPEVPLGGLLELVE